MPRMIAVLRAVVWVAFLALAPGCESERGTPFPVFGPSTPPPSPQPPGPPEGIVSGVVFESTTAGRRPLALRLAEVELEVPPCASAVCASKLLLMTDAQGRYSTGWLPAFTVVRVTASNTAPVGRYLQPAAATAIVNGDRTVDVEFLASLSAPRTLDGSPTLSGVVFETTSEGRRVRPNTEVLWDPGCEGYGKAWTVSDADGRYELYRLPLGPTCITTWTLGTGFFRSRVIDITGDTVADLDH